jgi:hypothetical protein
MRQTRLEALVEFYKDIEKYQRLSPSTQQKGEVKAPPRPYYLIKSRR